MVFYQSRGDKGLDSNEPFSPTLYASLRLRGSINGKRILCRFNPKIGRFSCILIIIAINRAIMDHQTGAAGQRPQKLTAKIERMGGGWTGELEEYRNTAGNRSPPASYCLPPQTLPAFARLQTDLSSDHRPCHNWPLAQACTQKSPLPPPF